MTAVIARLLLFTMVVVGTQRDTEPGKKNHAPDNAEQPLRLKDLPLVYDWYHLNKLTATTFVIPMLFPAPGTVMISGQRSSLKSAIFMTLGLMVAYGCKWIDGSQLPAGLVCYITNESTNLLKPRYYAWLRANGKPESENMQDNFKMVNIEHSAFRREVERKVGRGTRSEVTNRLDLLDEASVRLLIDHLREIFKSLNLPVRIVGLDNATSLIREKLTDEVTRKLTASMTLISTELECCVALVNHTWKNDSNRAQGPIRCRITSTATTLWRVTGTMR